MKTTIRKVKKLSRDPKRFFYDSKFFRKSGSFLKKSENKDSEPRVVGEINFESKELIVTKEKKIINGSFSTLFLVDGEAKNLSRAPILGNLFKNPNDFIGFREKTLFALRVKGGDVGFFDVYEQLIHMKEWHSGILASFKNIVLVGRFIKYAEFFRSSNVECRIYAILNEHDSMVRPEIYEYIDHFICHKNHIDRCDFSKDLTFFRNTRELINSLEQRINQSGIKPYDYLVPVYGDVQYLDDIDKLNEEAIDICIKLIEMNKNTALHSNNFNEYINKLSKDIEFLLMRESWMQRYASLVSKNNIADLLKLAIKDGARVKVK